MDAYRLALLVHIVGACGLFVGAWARQEVRSERGVDGGVKGRLDGVRRLGHQGQQQAAGDG